MSPTEAMRVLESAGLLTVKLARDLYVVLVPVRATTIAIVAPDSFQPHEKREEIGALRPLFLMLDHDYILPADSPWIRGGAVVLTRIDPDEITGELLRFGFDLEAALEKDEKP